MMIDGSKNLVAFLMTDFTKKSTGFVIYSQFNCYLLNAYYDLYDQTFDVAYIYIFP